MKKLPVVILTIFALGIFFQNTYFSQENKLSDSFTIEKVSWVSNRPWPETNGKDGCIVFYKLEKGDAIDIQGESGNYYFIAYSFDSKHEPIYGWILKETVKK